MPVRPLGYVLTDREDPATAPAQAALGPHEVGRVVVFDEYAEGLGGVEALDYAWLILWLDRAPAAAPFQLVPRPLHETGERRGVFATRAPARPNRLGLSLVRILGLDGTVIWFSGVDMAQGTPVLDIKPYESQVDTPVSFLHASD